MGASPAVVDLGNLSSDILQNVVYLATPPLLWLLLFLLAWQTPALARATGFGRLAFWLLLPGALLGTIGNLPLLSISVAVLAINLGGGVLPLILSGHLLLRRFDQRLDLLVSYLLLFVAESAALLLWVVYVGSAPGPVVSVAGSFLFTLSPAALGVLVLGVAVPLTLGLATRRTIAWPPVTFGLALTSLALVATFLTTEAAPGVGIVSSFPGYLLAPLLAGVGGVLGVRTLTGRPAYQGFAFAYAASTFGVLVGADVLHQPPLYSPAANALYSIGGAGLLDLLYLSGLLALAASFLTYGILRRAKRADPPSPLPGGPPLTAPGKLRRSLVSLLSGHFAESARGAAEAALEARSQCRALLGLPAASFSDHPWAEMGAPPWVDGDQVNLDGLARRLDIGARDAWRAHLTARYLVRLARQLARRRFGSLARRSVAFLIDLGFLLAPAVAVWWYLSATLGGSVAKVLGSSVFNAAAYGFAAYAFAYFVIAELVVGSTLGKQLLRLRVRDRQLRAPPLLPVVVRDLPKLIPLSIVGFGGAVATLITVRGGATGGMAAGVSVPVALFALADLVVVIGFGVFLCGVASVIAIHASSENQRLGDYLAGTWVIQE